MKAKKLFPDLSIRRLWDKIKELDSKMGNIVSSNLIADDGTVFHFGVNEDGKYGYIVKNEDGTDRFIEFNNNTLISASESGNQSVSTTGGTVMVSINFKEKFTSIPTVTCSTNDKYMPAKVNQVSNTNVVFELYLSGATGSRTCTLYWQAYTTA